MKNPEDWMYMYSENGRDYFKNECTRQYKSYRQFNIIDYIKFAIEKILLKGKSKRNE